jgi:peptidoglycan/xylan/chitin deacetylase (PgdA/CDA1 family)
MLEFLQVNGFNYSRLRFMALILSTTFILLAGCSSGENVGADNIPSPAVSSETNEPPSTLQTRSVVSETPDQGTQLVPNSTPQSAHIPSTTPAPIPFEGELFDTEILWDDVQPVRYIDDQCKYLQLKWDPENSPPGTIVVPIMFHSVAKSGRVITDTTSISEEYFHSVLTHASALGFRTITTEELVGFLTINAPIPPLSMIMILDDRRPGVTERFLPYLTQYDWTLTLGWIIQDQREYLWNWMEYLAESGRLDVQSHGYWHKYIVEETPDEIISEELYDPIPILEQHFGYRPTAFIWPGGNFTERSIQVAHEAGYQLGFSAYAHGPYLFNWIPQSEEEIAIGDPLMTLPRYWSPTAWRNLDNAIQISAEARAFALAQYALEEDWYQQSCGSALPPAPQ